MSEKKTLTKGQKARKAIIIVLCCLVGLVLVLLLGIRGYFRIPVSEYYKNSEKAFVIPGLSDGMTHQGLAYDSENDTFLYNRLPLRRQRFAGVRRFQRLTAKKSRDLILQTRTEAHSRVMSEVSPYTANMYTLRTPTDCMRLTEATSLTRLTAAA